MAYALRMRNGGQHRSEGPGHRILFFSLFYRLSPQLLFIKLPSGIQQTFIVLVTAADVWQV